MCQPRSVSIVTAYHFPASEKEKYQRLLNSARSSLREIGDRGHLILVANGTNEGAEPLESVIQDIAPARRELVVPVVLERNVRRVGGLNAGIKKLVDQFGTTDNSLVGSVQSNVILQPGWLRKLDAKLDGCENDVAFGRILYEDDPSKIWADGHNLKDGKIHNVNYNESTTVAHDEVENEMFPCLNAALFCGKLVGAIVAKYGDFVFSGLEHYGDCTDVALRAKAENARFHFCRNAVAMKLPRSVEPRAFRSSQFVAIGLYYQDRHTEGIRLLVDGRKDKSHYIAASSDADVVLQLPYSASGRSPPSAQPLEVGCWL